MSRTIFSKDFSFALLTLSVAALFLGAPDLALAQDDSATATGTLGNVLCNAFENAKPFGSVFQWIAYIFGVISALTSVHFFRLHVDDPRNNKLGVPLAFLGGAMGLLALPGVVSVMVNSLYTVDVEGGSFAACSPGEVTESESKGLDNMMIEFVENIHSPMLAVTSLTAILAGLFFVINGLTRAAKYGTDPRTHTLQKILTPILFGALLITVGTNLDMMLSSLFGTGDDSTPSRSIEWSKIEGIMGKSSEGMERFEMAVDASLLFVQIMGAVAFVRGWLIVKKVVEGGGNTSLTQGLTHILGGVLAVNIGTFLQYMDKTFGSYLIQP